MPELFIPPKDSDTVTAYASYEVQLGDVECALPPGYLPVAAPFWLGAALHDESESAERLIGVHILQKCGDLWTLGEIESPNDNPEVTVKVTKEGLSGERMANFSVKWLLADESTWERLQLADYACSAGDDDGSWCIIWKPAKARKKVLPALCVTQPALPAPRGPTPDHPRTALVVRGPTPDKPPPAASARATPSSRKPAAKSPASAKTGRAPPKSASKKAVASTEAMPPVAQMTAAQKRYLFKQLQDELCEGDDPEPELVGFAGP